MTCWTSILTRLIHRLVLISLGLITVAGFAQEQKHSEGIKKAEAVPINALTIQEFSWVDKTRTRSVLAKLYWPALSNTKSSQPKIPLVIFSHGIWGSKDDYSYIGRYLAENSIACLHIQHAGSDSSVWNASFLKIPQLLYLSTRNQEAIYRAKDFQFALTQILQTSPYQEAIDKENIVAAGHSFGANTSMLVSGAQVAQDGSVLSLHDPRVKMAVIISAPPFYGNDNEATQKILSGIKIPTLHITTSNDKIRVPGFRSPPQDRIKIFDNMKNSAKNLVVFNDGPHGIFTDKAFNANPELSSKIHKASRELILSFIQNHGEPELLENTQTLHTWSLQNSSVLEKTQWSFQKQATAQK